MSDGPPGLPPPNKWHTASWVLYDLANTVFAATVTFLLAPHLRADWTGVANSAAMIFAAFGTPLVASMADRTDRAGRYCALATLGCIAAMVFFGVFTATPPLLAAFFIATVCYQAALVFYNALLPSVARPEHMGVVSGLGVGLGYVGTVFTLVIVIPVQRHYGLPAAFFVATGTFLIGALPCMLLVRDRRPIASARFSWALARQEGQALLQSLRDLPRHPTPMWFLIANFFAVDVLNTAILFYGKLLRAGFGAAVEHGELVILGHRVADIGEFLTIGGLAVNLPALVSGLLIGHMADGLGARRAYATAIVCLLFGLVGAAVFIGRSPLAFLIAMSCFGGLGLAGIWTAGRKLLTELVPREQVGRYFGLYGVTNKVSIIGSSVCGVIMETLGPRMAILSQVLPLLLALHCLHRMCRAGRR